MFANLGPVHGESFIHRHEFAVVLKEIDQPLGGEVVCGAGIKALLGTELLNDGLQETLFGLTVSLHHFKDFMSVYHVTCFLISKDTHS